MNHSKFVCWNVRGLNSRACQDSVHNLINSFNANVVCIQETKMAEISMHTTLSALGSNFVHKLFLPSVGTSGGILVARRNEIGPASATRVDHHSVTIRFSPRDHLPWWLTCVYGPQGDSNRIQFMQELRDVRSACPGPWILMGDFNLIYRDEDKSSGNFNRQLMERFRRFINDLGLKELALHGQKFTWSNRQDTPTLVKLDIMFCSSDWEQLFPNSLLQSASTDGSDHCPMLLGLQVLTPGRIRFHFESHWTKLPDFIAAMEAAWNSVPSSPCPFETLSKKFRATVKRLQSWSQKRVGHISSQLGMAREIMHKLQSAQDNRPLSMLENWLLKQLDGHIVALSTLQCSMARSSSRITCWLRGMLTLSSSTSMLNTAKARILLVTCYPTMV
jgi:exonuclease III